jgi:hypothetical protein
MNNSRKLAPGVISVFALLLPVLARAHPGPRHAHGWQDDWSYLFGGLDYLYAMLFAGLLVILLAIRGLRSDA